jgi:hypothetical protein
MLNYWLWQGRQSSSTVAGNEIFKEADLAIRRL